MPESEAQFIFVGQNVQKCDTHSSLLTMEYLQSNISQALTPARNH
jgi:hypothetical protein